MPVRDAGAQQSPSQRPRIGLALSGGGARGAAHIGVLKVLESMRVPVDCVAGTSMGAVVGGAYAAGTSAEEMEQVVANTDWVDVFTDQPPRGEISIRRKEDDYKGLFAPEFGIRDGAILLPKGVVAGVTIEGFLRRLSAPAASVSEFDRLPIPYRAVATDIATGEEVVLARGSLVRAMRASMAIPGALAPVEIDDRLLVDGGISNNLPIDVVRNLCNAEVVIAVNIGTPALTREQLGSSLAIVGQLTSFLGKATVDRQLAGLTARDVLIAPDLGDISAASFDRQKEAIAIGEVAARRQAGALAGYAVSPAQYAALRERRQHAGTVLGPVDEIRFEGIERTNAEVLSTLMASKPGRPLTEPQLDADLRRIYGRGDFESVDYRIERGPGRSALVVQVREKSIGPDYLRFGLALASDFHGQAHFNALASYRRTWLNRAGGEWLSEAQVGKDNYLFSEFYQPFERRGRYFVAPYARISRSTEDIFVGDDRVARYEVTETRLGVDLGTTLGTWGEVRIGPIFRDLD
ncbi:MAG: esterase, partial [Limnobacter sp.]|nr:esterase [Limnobacter sp.]